MTQLWSKPCLRQSTLTIDSQREKRKNSTCVWLEMREEKP